MMKLVSRAHLEAAATDAVHTTIGALAAHAEGLIALTGGPDGPIDRALREGQQPLAEERLKRLAAAFGDRLYVEIQRHGLKSEHDVEPQLLQLAYALGIPIVATNEAYFASPDDYEAHDALLCIADGRYVVEDDRRRVTREHDFKSAEAMAQVFADLPEALDNTIEIARRCAFRPKGRKPILPRFVAGDDVVSETEQARRETAELRRQAEQGLRDRLAAAPPAPGFTVSRLREAARLRDRRHRAHEVPRLLPDRRRLHQVGEGARDPRRSRAAARAPARSSPGRSPSPTSIRCASGCCLSAS